MVNERIAAAIPEPNNGEVMVVVTDLRLSSEDRWRRMIRQELFRAQMGKEEAETFEEADDFDLEDDEEWFSPYEDDFDPPEVSVEHSGNGPSPTPPVTNTPPNGGAPSPPPAGENVPGQ